MSGYFCIAMLEDPPYNIFIAATEENPEDWLDALPLPSHLLSYEYFGDAQAVERDCLIKLKALGIDAKSDKAFTAKVPEVMEVYQQVRDRLKQNQISVDDFDEVNYQDQEALVKAAKEGNVGAQYQLAEAYNYHVWVDGVELDHEKANYWYRKAAEQGHIEAQLKLAKYYYMVLGVKKSDKKSIFWYQKAAEQGHSESQLLIGKAYHFGNKGVEKDKNQALFWYQKAAEQGHAEAQYELGNAYFSLGYACFYYKNENFNLKYNFGIEKDDKQAVYWYQKAADQGHNEAQLQLGYAYYHGSGVQNDLQQAIYWYHKAAEQCIHTQDLLGVMYAQGRNISQDDEQAIHWFRKAAEQGLGSAQDNLGIMYQSGRGVEQDNVQAFSWFKKAASYYPRAQYHLGVMYSLGLGVERNYRRALFWYCKADTNGDDTAQFNLGVMYYNGEGVRKNIKKAVSWFRKSAEQGNTSAQKVLKELGNDCENSMVPLKTSVCEDFRFEIH